MRPDIGCNKAFDRYYVKGCKGDAVVHEESESKNKTDRGVSQLEESLREQGRMFLYATYVQGKFLRRLAVQMG
jgi:hypothetical protein